MSWEDDDFEVAVPEAAAGGGAAPAAPAAPKAPKKVSLETSSYEKQHERAMEEKAALEAQVVEAKAAVEKARAEAKGTAASKAYVASLEKKVTAAEEAVVAKEKAIHKAEVEEGRRRYTATCMKRGVKSFDFTNPDIKVAFVGRRAAATARRMGDADRAAEAADPGGGHDGGNYVYIRRR